jgi:hypothetical protein
MVSYVPAHSEVDGQPFIWWERVDELTGISLEYSELVVFIYGSKDDAMRSSESGGSGFVVLVESTSSPGFLHRYAVTNRHVVDADFRVVRFSGDTIPTSAAELDWVRHPDGDDVAAAYIPPDVVVAKGIGVNRFVTLDRLNDGKFNLLPGDDVFMTGRFIGLDRRVRNTPTSRFGSVSMPSPELMPDNDDTNEEHEYFLAEMRSLPGYSGSPVFLWRQGMSIQPPNKLKLDTQWIYLLGIDVGHISGFTPVVEWDKQLRKYVPAVQGPYVEEHSGMTQVVPAWKIAELLEADELVAKRRQIDDSMKEDRERPRSATRKDATREPLTRGEFESALRKVSRRKPSQPDEGTTGTSA